MKVDMEFSFDFCELWTWNLFEGKCLKQYVEERSMSVYCWKLSEFSVILIQLHTMRFTVPGAVNVCNLLFWIAKRGRKRRVVTKSDQNTINSFLYIRVQPCTNETLTIYLKFQRTYFTLRHVPKNPSFLVDLRLEWHSSFVVEFILWPFLCPAVQYTSSQQEQSKGRRRKMQSRIQSVLHVPLVQYTRFLLHTLCHALVAWLCSRVYFGPFFPPWEFPARLCLIYQSPSKMHKNPFFCWFLEESFEVSSLVLQFNPSIFPVLVTFQKISKWKFSYFWTFFPFFVQRDM